MDKKPSYNALEKRISDLERQLRDSEKRIDQALMTRDQRFRKIIEHVSGISIQGYDIYRNVIFWNPASETLYGYSEKEALGKKLEALIIPEGMKDTIIRLHKDWVENDVEIPAGELLLLDKFGNKVPVFSSHVMLEGELGKEMYCIDVNLRSIKAVEQEKKDLLKQLKQVQKMEAIGTLAGGIAHDFNNILFPILGLSELLMADLPQDSLTYQHIEKIHFAGKRAKELVHQILSFSRQTEQTKVPLKLQSILKEAVKLCRSAIPTNIDLNLKIMKDVGYVSADAIQIHQVFMNLITNAYQSLGEQNGSIEITLDETVIEEDNALPGAIPPAPYAKFTISDTGIGMPPEVMERIYEPYFTTKVQGKGTGLGLAMVYAIIKDHLGDIAVESEPGNGATFTIFLPLIPAKEDENSTPPHPTEPFQTGTERILLVDDEELVLKLEIRMLERMGYRVSPWLNSVEALEAFKTAPHRYDLVVTDMAMPKMTGDQLAQAMLEIRPELPIILVTGFSDSIDEKKAYDIGFKGFLLKPTVMTQLAEAIRIALTWRTGKK